MLQVAAAAAVIGNELDQADERKPLSVSTLEQAQEQ
jgi:hypothetical protein